MKVWFLKSGQLIRTLQGHTRSVNAVAFSPDGKLVATASSDKTLIIWEVVTGRKLTYFTCDGEVTCCAFAGDDLIAGDDSGLISFLTLEL